MNFQVERIDARRHLVFSEGAVWLVVLNGCTWTATLFHGQGTSISDRNLGSVLGRIAETSVSKKDIYLTHVIFREKMYQGRRGIPRAYKVIGKCIERMSAR